jgi:hypothetical protein
MNGVENDEGNSLRPRRWGGLSSWSRNPQGKEGSEVAAVVVPAVAVSSAVHLDGNVVADVRSHAWCPHC